MIKFLYEIHIVSHIWPFRFQLRQLNGSGAFLMPICLSPVRQLLTSKVDFSKTAS